MGEAGGGYSYPDSAEDETPQDRAAILARIADECMASGGNLPFPPPDGAQSLEALLYPPYPADPYEVRFALRYPDTVIVCSRSLAGYSLLGGLRREHERRERRARFRRSLRGQPAGEEG